MSPTATAADNETHGRSNPGNYIMDTRGDIIFVVLVMGKQGPGEEKSALEAEKSIHYRNHTKVDLSHRQVTISETGFNSSEYRIFLEVLQRGSPTDH